MPRILPDDVPDTILMAANDFGIWGDVRDRADQLALREARCTDDGSGRLTERSWTEGTWPAIVMPAQVSIECSEDETIQRIVDRAMLARYGVDDE